MSAQRRKSAEVSCMHMIIQNPVSGRRQATRATMRCTRRIKWRRIRLPVAAMPDLHAAAARPLVSDLHDTFDLADCRFLHAARRTGRGCCCWVGTQGWRDAGLQTSGALTHGSSRRGRCWLGRRRQAPCRPGDMQCRAADCCTHLRRQ